MGALSGEAKGVGCVGGGGRSSESRPSAGSAAPREEKGVGGVSVVEDCL